MIFGFEGCHIYSTGDELSKYAEEESKTKMIHQIKSFSIQKYSHSMDIRTIEWLFVQQTQAQLRILIYNHLF